MLEAPFDPVKLAIPFFILAIVLVDGNKHEGPFYVRQPFTQEPDWAETSKNLDLGQLLAKAVAPGASL